MPKKIFYVLYQIDKALAFEWIIDNLDKKQFELSFILIGSVKNAYLERFCLDRNIPVYTLEYHGKKDLLKCMYSCMKIFRKEKPDVIHTHLFEACIIGLTTAKLMGIKRRIYTRHHCTYHHVYYPKAVKYDRYINSVSTDIIAISGVVKDTLIELENVPPQKIILIHHGFDLAMFNNPNLETINDLALKYNPLNKFPVIGIISRYFHLKGIEYGIEAFKRLLVKNPNALLILANAKGQYKDKIKEYLDDLPATSYLEIPFEVHVESLYRLFSIYMHLPIDKQIEAFGQTYVEALASGVPMIATLSGVANEFLIDHQNAIIVPYKDSNAVYSAILELIEDKQLCNQLIENGKRDVSQKFSLNLMIDKLTNLYLS